MNAPLPRDIAQHMAEAATEFRAAMAMPEWWRDTGWTADSMQAAAEEYAREQAADANALRPDEPGYEVENTK